MQTVTQQTSDIAKGKVDAKKHREIILKTLEQCEYPLTAYGISKRCALNYVAVNRRMKELRDNEQVTIVCKLLDLDGSVRAAYRLV